MAYGARGGSLPFKGKLKDISDFADVYRNDKKRGPTPSKVMEPDGPPIYERRNLRAPDPVLSGDVLRETTSRLYSQARPGHAASLFEQEGTQQRPQRRRGPVSKELLKIKPAEDFEDTPDLTPLGSVSPFVGAPLKLPPSPELSAQEFSMLGGEPERFGAVQNALRNLPQVAPMAQQGSGVNASELFKDLADDQDRRIFGAKPSTWLGAGALGASFALGPQAAELAGAGGTLAGPLARAGVGALGGAGGSELMGGDVGTGALTGSVLGPMTEDAISALSPALARAFPAGRRLASMYDEPIATAAERAPTSLLKPDELVDDLPTAIEPTMLSNTAVRGGTQTQALPRGPTSVTNINTPPNRSMTQIGDAVQRGFLQARPPITPHPSDFPAFGSLDTAPPPQGALPIAPPRAATSLQRPPPLAQTEPVGVGNSTSGLLPKLDRFSGRVLRNPLAAGMLLSTAGMGGVLGGLGMGAGQGNVAQAASAAPPPRAVQLPTPTATPSQPPMLEPTVESEPDEFDLAQALAELDGASFESLPADQWNRYFAEARELLGGAGPQR